MIESNVNRYCSNCTIPIRGNFNCRGCQIPLMPTGKSKADRLDYQKIEETEDPMVDLLDDEKVTVFSTAMSTKGKALIRDLIEIRRENPQIKSIVFSQWTTMLNLLEPPLKDAGIKFVRLDGKMSREERSNASKFYCLKCLVNRFKTEKSITVFLMSLRGRFRFDYFFSWRCWIKFNNCISSVYYGALLESCC